MNRYNFQDDIEAASIEEEYKIFNSNSVKINSLKLMFLPIVANL